MNVNYEYYRIFYYVVIYQNITKASLRLNISQPAISKTIKLLEQQLRVKLFIRSNRGVKLTDEGKTIFEDIKRGIEHFENVENIIGDFNKLKKGKIAIGASTTITRHFLFPFLDKFHKKYPGIEIILDTDSTDELIDKLNHGILDIIFSTDDFNNQKFEITEFMEIHDAFLTSDYELSKRTIDLNNINDYNLILQTDKSSTRRYLDNICYKEKVSLNPILNLSSFTLMIDFIKRGYGVGFGTLDFLKKEISNGEIFVLKINKKIEPRKIKAMCKSNQKNKIIEVFINIVKQESIL